MPTSPSSPVFVPRKVSVVVPVYDEESNLPALLPRLLAVLRAGLQLDAHDVRVGAVGVDEVATRIGDVREENGVEGTRRRCAWAPASRSDLF